ncbi:MAG: glycosyltransferase family 4 protein [Acidobacteria bacterium]|nr:glycosyltransferase family 4 protein [Acidobacteriota bacterium]
MAEDRVLHVALAGARGGAEMVAEHILLAAQAREGAYHHHVAAPSGSALIHEWRARGIAVTEVPPLPRFRDLAGARRLTAGLTGVVRASKACVVHTHGIAGQIYGGRAAAAAGRPVVWHIHDRQETRFTMDGVLHRLAARARTDVAIAVSHMVADSWRGRVAAGRLEVVHNGVLSEVVPPALRPSGTSGPLVVWCGRLQHWKGTHVFLDVAAAVRRVTPDARFVVVGGTLFGLEPEYPVRLRQQAHTLGLTDVIEWVGHVDDARPWLAAADVVVHSAVQPEPFGLVIAEAMMQSCPVVAFGRGGPAEIVEDGQTGCLVPPDDVAAMADAVAALLAAPERRRMMGQAGRVRAMALFSVPEMVRRVESAYDRARTQI